MISQYEVVLWTGQRHWQDHHTIHRVLDLALPLILIEGAAKGADTIAHQWAAKQGYDVVTLDWKNPQMPELEHEFLYNLRFPVSGDDWGVIGKGAGMRRNEAMLAFMEDHYPATKYTRAVIGSVDQARFGKSKGTIGCLQKARTMGVEAWEIPKDMESVLGQEESSRWRAWWTGQASTEG